MDTMQPAASYVADFFDIPDTVTEIERLLLKDDMAYLCCLEEDGTSYLAAMDIDDGKFLKQNLDLDLLSHFWILALPRITASGRFAWNRQAVIV